MVPEGHPGEHPSLVGPPGPLVSTGPTAPYQTGGRTGVLCQPWRGQHGSIRVCHERSRTGQPRRSRGLWGLGAPQGGQERWRYMLQQRGLTRHSTSWAVSFWKYSGRQASTMLIYCSCRCRCRCKCPPTTASREGVNLPSVSCGAPLAGGRWQVAGNVSFSSLMMSLWPFRSGG